MAVRNYLGNASAEVQEHNITVSDTTNTNTLILTLTNGSSSVTDAETWTNGGAETTTTVATGVAALIEKSTNGLFARMTASSSGAVVNVRSKFPGEPFSLAITGTATAPTVVVVNNNSGGQDFNCESNWAEGAVATTGDDIIFRGAARVRFNANQSAVTFGKISTSHDFTGDIGCGNTFQCLCTDLDVFGRGRGSIDLGNSAITPIVHSTAQVQPGEFAWTVKGSALTSLTVRNNSSVAVAAYQGQTSSATTVNVEGGRYFAGSGLTNTTTNQTGGDMEVWHAATTINSYSGDRAQIMGAGAITTLRMGSLPNNVDTSGTITNLESLGTIPVNMTRSRTTRTVTNPKVYGSGGIVADTSVVTFSNAVVGRADGIVNAVATSPAS